MLMLEITEIDQQKQLHQVKQQLALDAHVEIKRPTLIGEKRTVPRDVFLLMKTVLNAPLFQREK